MGLFGGATERKGLGMAGELRQLVYISDASYGLAKPDIESILASSRRNNAEANVSGMLLYSSGVFIQALEGRPETIEGLYKTISDDRRHENVDTVSDRLVADRSFGGWAMGFVERAPEEVSSKIGINGLMDRNEALAALSANEEVATSMLRDFAENLY